MQKLLKISQQTAWQIIVKAITTVSGFIILGIVSRTYGEVGTGNFTLALTYLAFFYILSDFGLNAEVLKKAKSKKPAPSEATPKAGEVEGSKVKNEWQKLLGTRIAWSGILLLASMVVILMLPPPFSEDFKWASIFGSLIILFYAINITAAGLFQANDRYDLDIPPTLFGVAIGTVVIWFGSREGWPVYLVILGYTTAWLVHSVGSYFLAASLAGKLTPIFDKQYARDLFKTTWPLAGTLFLNVIYFRVDAFILSYYRGSVDVGIYNMAYQFFQAILVLPAFIMNSFYPIMLETLKVKSQQLKVQIRNAAFLLVTFSLGISLITYFLSPFLIKLVTGSGFAGSVVSLQILSFGLPAYFLSALLMWVMITKGMYKKLLLIYGLGLTFNILANLLFIPQHSFYAASWITGASEYLILGMQAVLLLFERRREYTL